MLGPYRVLDLTEGGCLVAGKNLADSGADVIKIEPPGGSPSRNIGPAFRLSKTPNSQWAPAIYGQHDHYVLKVFLGLSDDDIADLYAEWVLTTEEDVVSPFGSLES